MANRAMLVGCPSRDAAERIALEADQYEVDDGPFGPQLSASYHIPLFWLAAFAPADVLEVVRREDDGAAAYTFPAYFTPTSAGLKKLRARRIGVLALVGERFAGFYDDWHQYLQEQYPDGFLLQAEDIFWMIDMDEGAAAVAAIISDLDGLERGVPISDLEPFRQWGALPHLCGDDFSRPDNEAAMFWRASLAGGAVTGSVDWPTEPTQLEIEAIEPLRQADAARMAMAMARAKKPWWKFWA